MYSATETRICREGHVVKLRSRGLGRKELVMDFRDYEIARDGDEVVVTGTIREPVNWDFTIRINGADIPGMLRLGLHRHTLAMAVRWVFHRRGKTKAVPDVPRSPSEASQAEARARTPAVSPRAVVRDSGAEPMPAAPKPTPVAVPSVLESRSKSSAKTPDFGAPRRRGGSNGEHAPATDVIAEGERR
jgi:hypothetical protein